LLSRILRNKLHEHARIFVGGTNVHSIETDTSLKGWELVKLVLGSKSVPPFRIALQCTILGSRELVFERGTRNGDLFTTRYSNATISTQERLHDVKSAVLIVRGN
jgi:hypothetical protein